MKNSLAHSRLIDPPALPDCLRNVQGLRVKKTGSADVAPDIASLFPKSAHPSFIRLESGEGAPSELLRVGVVFSGGQAPGGHNVIAGCFDALKQVHKEAHLIGFLNGPSGIINNQTMELKEVTLAPFRNTGGFHLLGSGRTKIEGEERLAASLKTCQELDLDGLVIIGGDDSNTNAALLAEYFLSKGAKTKVIGVPKTIDGDLKNAHVSLSFGFDTATKTYSELIGNLCLDALSAKKYTHFVKLMGRSASHVALECAMQTHPNVTLIGEEIAFKQKTLKQIVKELTDVVVKRAKANKNYGVFLIPEGVIEFIPEFKALIHELNSLLTDSGEQWIHNLSTSARSLFDFLPQEIRLQLVMDRDPHGNVQVSHIATEKLLIELIREELKKREDSEVEFHPVSHFFGYEGRCAFPSAFDASYCYALGKVAICLIRDGVTSCMCAIENLKKPVAEWSALGVPLVSLLTLEERKGKLKPVIEKAYVDLKGRLFQEFEKERSSWILEDDYRSPGPIQYFGPEELIRSITYTLEKTDECVKAR